MTVGAGYLASTHGNAYLLVPADHGRAYDVHTGKNAWMLWRTTFLIDEKYTPIKAIGKGAYGVVCSAKVAPSGDKVAIKKIGKQQRPVATPA